MRPYQYLDEGTWKDMPRLMSEARPTVDAIADDKYPASVQVLGTRYRRKPGRVAWTGGWIPRDTVVRELVTRDDALGCHWSLHWDSVEDRATLLQTKLSGGRMTVYREAYRLNSGSWVSVCDWAEEVIAGG